MVADIDKGPYSESESIVVYEALLSYQHHLALTEDRSLELTRRTVASAIRKAASAIGIDPEPVIVPDHYPPTMTYRQLLVHDQKDYDARPWTEGELQAGWGK